MNKQQFITSLRQRLAGLPSAEVEERLSFYSEMIDDMIEEGLSDEEALSKIGSVDEIAEQITMDIPLVKIAKEKLKPQKRLSGLEILLLVLGSPIWVSFLIAALAVILSVYIVLWSVIISLWSVFVSFVACAFGGLAAFCVFISSGNVISAVALLGAGILCAGLSIFTFYGCKSATKGILIITKKIAVRIKNCLISRRKRYDK